MRREWKIRIGWLILGLTLGSLPQCSKLWNIDSCLDDGGSWNYKAGKCEF